MDFNGDGYKDLIVGDRNGYVNYFRRLANGDLTTEPDIIANGSTIDIGYNSAPCVVDWNEDGLLDLLLGSETPGRIRLYLNSGSTSSYLFTTYTEIQCHGSFISYSRITPQSIDMTFDGKKDLVMGEDYGHIYFAENVGTNAAPVFNQVVMLESNGSAIAWPSGQTDTRVWINDWNEDGYLDMLMGNYVDSLYLYMNTPLNVLEEPNPVLENNVFMLKQIFGENSLQLSVNLLSPQTVDFRIYAINGRMIEDFNKGFQTEGNYNYSVDISDYSPGIYFVNIKLDGEMFTERFSIVR